MCILSEFVGQFSWTFLFSRFVASELVRSDKDDRMRSIITTDRVYFVKNKGPPSPDAIVLQLDYGELFDARPLFDGKQGAFHSWFSKYLEFVFVS